MRLALRKTHVGQKFLESRSRRGSPLYTAPQILLRGPTRPFAEVVRFDCSRGSVK